MGNSNPFDNLNFEKFRELAKSEQLSKHEKVGFPDSYREGKEEAIFQDICSKLSALAGHQKTVLEIGPGCSQLPVFLASLCEQRQHSLILVDSVEMLNLLPDYPHVEKLAGRFPEVATLFECNANRVDVIIAYSVLQYVFAEANLWDFIDQSLRLLAPGGELFLGDIPNLTMRKRFFASAAGVACHQAYTNSQDLPEVEFNRLEPGAIDDSIVLAILARARAQGFHAWILPQAADLPMANRREDILIRRP